MRFHRSSYHVCCKYLKARPDTTKRKDLGNKNYCNYCYKRAIFEKLSKSESEVDKIIAENNW